MAKKPKTNVVINGQEYYKITRTIGHKIVNGKKVPEKKLFYGTSKTNAEQKYKKWLEEQARLKHEKQELIDAEKNKTFGNLAEDFTYNIFAKSSYAHGTKRRYEQSYRVHVKESSLMDIPIREVKARTIQNWYTDLDVSKQTLAAIKKWMAAFYKWLCINEYSDNVLFAVTTPDKPENIRHEDIIVWEQEEMKAILRLSVNHRLRFMILLMNYAGLRISECLGLKYSDIKDGIITINRQYYQGEICPPKHKSYRKLPMHRDLITGLEIHKEWHKREMHRNKYKTEFIFTSNSGKKLEYGNVRRSLMRFYKRNDIPVKSPHVYRSTFCTELCRQGAPLEVASKLMGHRSVEVTAKHYALVKEDVKLDAINKLPGSEPTSKYKIKKPNKMPRRIKLKN